MNRNNQIKDAAEDKNHLKKEETMKTTLNIKNRTTRNSFYIVLATGLFIIALALLTQPFSAEARGRFGFQKSPEQIMERLTDRLDLTEKQVEAIRPIIEEKVLRMNEMREKSGTDRLAVRTEMQKLRWDTEIRLNEILTDEQIEKYLELRQENRGKFYRGKFRGNRMGKGFNRTPEQAITRLTDHLDLTEEQAAEIEPIIKESLERKHEVFDKYGEKRREVRQAMRDEMQAIGDETHKQLSNILTDEQIEDLRTLREERRSRTDKWMGHPGIKNW
jgi:Spy/CpxP family protein refolding chaperone